MANNFDKKLGILILKDFLEKETDEDHSVTVPDIIKMLESHGIVSDRRTVYSDLKLLRDQYNMDIVTSGYRHFVASRDFELEEIKVLADMVQSSNFLTSKKTEDLLNKLESQTSVHQAKAIRRRIYTRNTSRNTNESVYLNVDRISGAINGNRKIHFRYFKYNVNKEKELRYDGMVYELSPFALIWVDQNYYLLGYDSKNIKMSHYRVDRMTEIEVTDLPRDGQELFDRTDMSTYTKKVFYMFTGDEARVTLRCRNYIVDSVIDRFGPDAMIIKDGDDHFTFTENVVVSNQFYSWISAFGKDIEIIQPASVRKGFMRHLNSLMGTYTGFTGIKMDCGPLRDMLEKYSVPGWYPVGETGFYFAGDNILNGAEINSIEELMSGLQSLFEKLVPVSGGFFEEYLANSEMILKAVESAQYRAFILREDSALRKPDREFIFNG